MPAAQMGKQRARGKKPHMRRISWQLLMAFRWGWTPWEEMSETKRPGRSRIEKPWLC
ncbi:hypothetical protein TH47_18120 [Thalassospira sp. MCCC 1A02803]|nr:hypothetical protein TH47_18120 [Thalassospira sp. MCCC 1A02803]